MALESDTDITLRNPTHVISYRINQEAAPLISRTAGEGGGIVWVFSDCLPEGIAKKIEGPSNIFRIITVA
jgi:hypothetical protein